MVFEPMSTVYRTQYTSIGSPVYTSDLVLIEEASLCLVVLRVVASMIYCEMTVNPVSESDTTEYCGDDMYLEAFVQPNLT